jgi:acetyl esterase/lipase
MRAMPAGAAIWCFPRLPAAASRPPRGARRRRSASARVQRIRYGEHPSQFCELSVPDGTGPFPVAVVVHGGFWRQRYGCDLQRHVAEDLRGRGWAAWNVEYRRVGGGGGWPATFADVAAGIDALAAPELPIDRSRVVAIGHSAGGHLVLWAAARGGLPAGAPGAGPRVRLAAAVAQAGAVDLHAVARAGLSSGAALDLLGGTPEQVPERYELASPARRLPLGVPLLLVHGEQDSSVPVQISRTFAAAARAAGDDCELVTGPGGHLEHLDPASDLYRAAATWIDAHR